MNTNFFSASQTQHKITCGIHLLLASLAVKIQTLAVICKHRVSVLRLVNLFLSISVGPAVNYMLTCPVVLCFFSYKLNHPKLHDCVGVQVGLISL